VVGVRSYVVRDVEAVKLLSVEVGSVRKARRIVS